MADELQVFAHTQRSSTYPAPGATALGNVVASSAFPTGFDLWLVRAELDRGVEIVVGRGHGDQAVYVMDGELECDGTSCGPGGAIVIDAGSPSHIGVLDRAVVLHYGTWNEEPPRNGPRGPVRRRSHGVSVVSASGVYEHDYTIEDDVAIHDTLLSDPRRRGGRLDLFRVETSGAMVARSHSHSEDEIIHVTRGTLQVGHDAVRAGMTMAIRGGRRYGFRTAGPYAFVNCRADLSTVTTGTETTPQPELAQRFLALAGSTN